MVVSGSNVCGGEDEEKLEQKRVLLEEEQVSGRVFIYHFSPSFAPMMQGSFGGGVTWRNKCLARSARHE